MQIALRILVVLVAIQGMTSSVDISSVAGLLERAGLHGLGFSVGVALNLLPGLLQSAQNAWRSLWMRGGLRKQRLRRPALAGGDHHCRSAEPGGGDRPGCRSSRLFPEAGPQHAGQSGKSDWSILGLSLIGCWFLGADPG